MKALLVIDVQNKIVNFADFNEEISTMEKVINDFKEKIYQSFS